VTQVIERLVGLGQRILGDVGPHWHPAGEVEKLDTVTAGEVGDRAHHALTRIRTWPGPGSGHASCCVASGSPLCLNCMARMAVTRVPAT